MFMTLYPPQAHLFGSRLGLTLSSDPTNAKYYGIGAAVLGGIVGGWIGSKAGAIAGTIGGALGLGMLVYYYFSGRGVPTVAQVEQSVAGNLPTV